MGANKIKKMCVYISIISFSIISNILISCNNFTKSHKEVVTNDVKLNDKIQISINYILPKDIYTSKEELFNDFFLDFYEFINSMPNGKVHLKNNNIESVDDLYKICKDYDKASGTGFPKVGDTLTRYFLYQRKGSNFQEQADKDYFIGYCLRNDKYVKFLHYLEVFFYHYRMDEGYTGKREDGKDPYGSDFFASSYASIIDTVKFFYYTKDTLPIFFYETKNIPELYDKIPGILKTPFDKNITISYDTKLNSPFVLPNNLKCYDFNFLGFYTDPEFKSTPVVYIDNDFIISNNITANNNTINLYAKFD